MGLAKDIDQTLNDDRHFVVVDMLNLRQRVRRDRTHCFDGIENTSSVYMICPLHSRGLPKRVGDCVAGVGTQSPALWFFPAPLPYCTRQKNSVHWTHKLIRVR